MKKILYIFAFLLSLQCVQAQNNTIVLGSDSIDYANPKEYVIAAPPEIEGVTTLDPNVLRLVSGLVQGARVKVPGEKFSEAVKNLWKQGFFDDVQINATRIEGEAIYLKIVLVEKLKMDGFVFHGGVKKKETDDFRTKLRLRQGTFLTDQFLSRVQSSVKEFYVNNGYANAKVTIELKEPRRKVRGRQDMHITVEKGGKVRIQEVNIIGNTVVSDRKLRRKLKESKTYKWWLFRGGKYLEENFEKDKESLLDKYLTLGYRDAHIVKDTTYFVSPNRVKIDITIDEGRKYRFRNITWIGNSKYRSGQLDTILGIKKGDVFNQAYLDQKLHMNPSGYDITGLYMDDGYLFFQLSPREVNVENDSIDYEISMYEGKPAIINRVTVVGNTKTNDHVIMREIRTRPGQLFRRSDVQRSIRDLSQLGYFNPEAMNVVPKPNQADGTVDIEYTVEEKPNDQISLSGGWGGGRIIGTLGVVFNNFSARNFFKKDSWSPLPSGDGQRLSVSAQSNGVYYQGYNISFTEPWLGGKKPQSLSVGAYFNVQNFNGQPRHIHQGGVRLVNPVSSFMTSLTGTVGFGRRLKWPDDYFQIYCEQTYSYYTLHRASVFLFQTGYANNIKTTFNISRNSLQGNPIFPIGGSTISLTSVLTPPWSLFNGKDYSHITQAEKYKFLEYQKYKFTTHWYMQLTNQKAPEGKEAHNLVLRASYGFGILGMYNSKVGVAPFERFYMGGSGLTGYSLDGREIIALRGYSDNSISGTDGRGNCIISKYTMELRYPLSLNPQATIFALAFAEAGNAEQKYKDFNPFNVKRSAGVGVRIFLPMFGLLGLDYGWGFDTVPYNPTTGNGKGQFHFTIGASLGEL